MLPQPRHWILWPVFGAVLIVLFGLLIKVASGVTGAEIQVDVWLSRNQDGFFGAIALTIDTVLSPAGNLVILVVSFLFLLFARRSPVNAFAFTSVAAFGWLSSEAFKLIVAMPRPNGHLLQHPLLAEVGHDSFPSGHTTFAVSYAIAAVLLARRTRWATLTTVVAILFAVLVAFSRLYVGAHYPSDVIGAFLVGFTAIAFYTGLWNRFGMIVLRRLTFLRRIGPVPAQ